jgi:hypothetical protein
MYELAKQRAAEQQRAAREAGEARARRAAARSRHGKEGTTDAVSTPAIPDFAHEMFEAARGTVPAPRTQDPRGRHARSGR